MAKDDNSREEKAKVIFATYPKEDTIFMVSDNRAFFTEHQADAYAQGLKDKKVEIFQRKTSEGVEKLMETKRPGDEGTEGSEETKGLSDEGTKGEDGSTASTGSATGETEKVSESESGESEGTAAKVEQEEKTTKKSATKTKK